MTTILHITSRQAWCEAQESGQYRAPSLDSQGYIHCSTPDQVIDVANFLFRGQADLVLLCLESGKVRPKIRYENLEGGQKLFPHVYGPIDVASVTRVLDLVPGEDGTFALPAELANS